jgi:hypothetical protein
MKILFFTKTSENEKINPKINQNNPKMVEWKNLCFQKSLKIWIKTDKRPYKISKNDY